MSYLVDVCLGLGDRLRAETLYDLLAPAADRIAVDVAEGSAGSVERLLGELAAMLGRDEDAIRHLRAAVEVNIGIGSAPWAASAQATLAGLLEDVDDAEAEGLLAAASATAEALGMAPLQARLALLA